MFNERSKKDSSGSCSETTQVRRKLGNLLPSQGTAQAASPRRSLRACPLPGLNEGDLQKQFKAKAVLPWALLMLNEIHVRAGIQFTDLLSRRRRSYCPCLLSGSSVKWDTGKIRCEACSAEESIVKPACSKPENTPQASKTSNAVIMEWLLRISLYVQEFSIGIAGYFITLNNFIWVVHLLQGEKKKPAGICDSLASFLPRAFRKV